MRKLLNYLLLLQGYIIVIISLFFLVQVIFSVRRDFSLLILNDEFYLSLFGLFGSFVILKATYVVIKKEELRKTLSVNLFNIFNHILLVSFLILILLLMFAWFEGGPKGENLFMLLFPFFVSVIVAFLDFLFAIIVLIKNKKIHNNLIK